MTEVQVKPALMPVGRPINLIPVGLKEAALDSPTFRATTVHFSEQVEIIERWLDGYLKSITKLSHEISTIESLVNAFLAQTNPPANLSEAVMDHDYSLLAMRRYSEGSKDFWTSTIKGMRKLELNMVEPIRGFLQSDLRSFKDTRRNLEYSQRNLDNLQTRYSAQAKSKEASSLREDAFQLHEARKSYLKASMDFCVVAPQLRMTLDKLMVKVFYDQWRDMRVARETFNGSFEKWGNEIERVRGWSREMENSEKTFQRELRTARKQIEETAELATRPSRELEDYSTSTSSTGGMKGPLTANLQSARSRPTNSEKQGWLNLRTITGKPARTVWVRRWFFVKNGIFGWLVQGSRSGGVEESERVGVLLCGVRPAPQEERRFCFEVKTKDTTVMLQAETQPELTDWMSAFDIAKQKALEDPASTDSPGVEGSRAPDPAFAILPPSAPEFAATGVDAGMQQASDEYSGHGPDRSATLPIPGDSTTNLASRSSFDVTSNKRSVPSEKDGEGSRDHAARIMQKLDMHRKSASGTPGTPTTPMASTTANPSGGIASLISASHNVLPVVLSPPVPEPLVSRTMVIKRDGPMSSLAPSTLANPPTPTNLSAAAVVVNGERGIGMGRADTTGGMPSGIMANLWGSSNWGHMNRLERGEVKASQDPKSPSILPPSPAIPPTVSPPKSVRVFSSDQQKLGSLSKKEKSPSVSRDPSPRHRKTVSLDGDFPDIPQVDKARQEFPNYYPVQLKTQDAQFRLLFPNVRREEKVVLVFRATWNPNDQQEFPGRIYVTLKDIYFYSHHLGLVLITGISLSSITEVTAAPGRDCDFLFLHLKESIDKPDFTRVTIKTFLEPLKLLQKRLNFLVQNCNSEEPIDIESVMKALIKIETEQSNRDSSLLSWEEDPMGDDDAGMRQQTARDLRAAVFVDGGQNSSGKLDDYPKFKLPSQPVKYEPLGTTNRVVEKELEVSPKALFHVMFGDRSAVWQLLYYERKASRVKQGPWVKQERNHMRRAFEYQIEYLDIIRQTCRALVVDYQMIDVQNDHLCYVVSDRKTPWHLPYHQYFTLLSKIVITHVAKSKCKLAIYTKVDWTRTPPFLKSIIEKRALSDLELDTLDLADVITDQVRKLGAHSRTKKAIQIFGPIGHQTQITELTAGSSSLTSQIRRSTQSRSLTHLLLEIASSLFQNIVTSLMMWGLALVKWVWKTGNANVFILFVTALSVLSNMLVSYQGVNEWWSERNAGRFMDRLGIHPDLTMSKTVYIQDLEPIVAADNGIDGNLDNPCFQRFDSLTSLELLAPSPISSKVRRLRQNRESIGSHRHDLIVALRVINSIEKEMLQATWENWVLDETRTCGRVQKMLARNETSTLGDEFQRPRGERHHDVKNEFERYCHSCAVAEERIGSGPV